MTVYTDNPFGGFGGGMRNLRMPRPPTNQPQMPPMNQMPRRMPGGPSKGGTTSIPMRRPPMQRPGGPGKGRARLPGYGGRGRGRPMPGGPGKGRGQMQQSMPFSPMMNRFNPALQRLTQGPMNAPPINFPQPAPSNNQIMGRPMPQPSGFNRGSFGQMGPPSNIQFQQAENNRPAPEFMGEVGQAFTQGPTSMGTPLSQMRTHALSALPLNRRFYGGGITDLY